MMKGNIFDAEYENTFIKITNNINIYSSFNLFLSTYRYSSLIHTRMEFNMETNRK